MNTATSVLMKPVATARVHWNPFPGLRPFREEEEYLFFGRESQVDAMVNKLAATHFLAVVGTSGSGKSSLVNSGLRPALHGGLMARAGTAWRMAQFRPGSNALRAMAHALAEDGVLFRDYQAGGLTLAEIVDTTLRMSKLGLIDIYEQAQLGEDDNLLVVVDQFEELFRYRQLGAGQQETVYEISEEATAFVNLLLEAKDQATYPIYVVLTMRSDFLGDCAQFPGLAEAINAGQYLVPRMTRDERRAAISGPVGVGRAEISPVLLTRLVNDVGDNPDQLSILQHALNRTWARWRNEGSGDGPLDLAHYQAIGTMAHALDRHAEKAYAELGTARERQICEKLFKALTDKATDPRGVRRPTTLGTLSALADATEAEVTDVIDVFRQPSRSFLMPPAGETLQVETVVDISHESLMRVWRRLKTWTDEEAQSAQMYRRLADTAALHAAGQASLWRGPDLQLALDWREREKPTETWAALYQGDFRTVTRFLQDSEAQVAEEKQVETRVRTSVLAVVFLVVINIVIAALFQGKGPARGTDLLSNLYTERQKESPDQEKIDDAMRKWKSLADSDITYDREWYASLLEIASGLQTGELGEHDQMLANILRTLEDRDLEKEKKLKSARAELRNFEEDHHAKVARWAIERVEGDVGKGTMLQRFAMMVAVMAIWPAWLALRRLRIGLRQLPPKRDVKAKPNPFWRIFAGLVDICVAVFLGILVCMFSSWVAGIVDLIVSGEVRGTANFFTAFATWTVVTTAYLLFRDSIKYTYHRSIGKIIFNLRPVLITPKAGAVTMTVSAKRNWGLALAVLPVLYAFLLEISTELSYSVGYVQSLDIVSGLITLIALILLVEEFTLSWLKDGRTLLDRLSKTKVIDIRTEENNGILA